MAVTSGIDIGYQTDRLREGGSQAGSTARIATGAAGVLRPATCPAPSLGAVAGAAALAAAVVRARDAHVVLAERVCAAHEDLQGRCEGAAADGDGLTAGTARIAHTGAPAGAPAPAPAPAAER
jgi:hypothetical protein